MPVLRTSFGWPGGGTGPLFAQLSDGRLAHVSDETTHHGPDAEMEPQLDPQTESQLDEAYDELHDARRRLAEVSVETVVVNHVMGLYELAAIHLGAAPPNLRDAALAIDAVACLVEGLDDRLGPDAATMRDALANIRIAFVQIKGAASAD